jgi:peptide/nickel transport system substrate-binding protein
MTFRLKQLSRFVLSTALTATLMGAGGGVVAQDLRIGLSSNPQSADPHFFNNDAISAMLSHVYETLITLDPDTKLVPGLALSWKAVNDNTWEFKLREGVKFHDGSPLTADVHSRSSPATSPTPGLSTTPRSCSPRPHQRPCCPMI